jgi:flagellar biosynthetic protein FlhB/flagellar biosynthetic protein FliR
MNYTGFVVYILIFVRIISFLGVSPLYMIRGVPNLLKAGFGLIISFLIFNFVSYNPSLIPTSMLQLAGAAVGECAFGLTLGFITSLFLEAIRMSGQLIDLQIGFSMINEFDPINSANVTLMGNLTNLLGLLIFFIINGHHILIEALIQSFNVMPLFGSGLTPEVSTYILTVFIKVVVISLKLAAPVVVVLLLTDITMGFISRTVPQLNILMMGLPIKMVIGLLVFSAALPALVSAYVKAFQGMASEINNFFKLFPLMIIFASGDKTEEPTPKKKEDARKKGQVAKSREFVSAITLLGITILAFSIGSLSLNTIEAFLTRSITNAGNFYISEGNVINLFVYCTQEFIKVTLPIFVTVMVLGVISNIAQTGFIFSTEPLKAKLNRINPIEGFKRMFSGKAYIELFKACANIAVVGYAGYTFVVGELPTIMKMPDMGTNSLLSVPMDIFQRELVRITIVVFVIGAIDFMFQKFSYRREMMMTKQEVKEELKQSEGDPQIKSRIKQKQREIASRRMMHEVPKATVVITNPTHLAIALKYEQGKDSVPQVIAKGADLIAQKIKKVASDNKVPIIENRAVARMLYEKVEIGDSIPVEMYQAVAEILAMVLSLNKKKRG